MPAVYLNRRTDVKAANVVLVTVSASIFDEEGGRVGEVLVSKYVTRGKVDAFCKEYIARGTGEIADAIESYGVSVPAFVDRWAGIHSNSGRCRVITHHDVWKVR